ncbi:MAG: hypothetical protein PVH37_14305 [Desulfobacterales bacterium]|jgi:hypothetical protein
MKVPLIGANLSMGPFALGAIGAMVVPKIIPVTGDLLRAVTKTGMKSGMIALDKSQALVTGTKDSFQDLLSEARSEISKKSTPAIQKKAAA